MSQQTNYINFREFINSWNKIYKDLDNLDYAMFQLINYIGYDLEKAFFKNLDEHSAIQLNHREICDLSFIIVDVLEVYMRKHCLSCPLKCYLDPEKQANLSQENIPVMLKNFIDINQKNYVNNNDCLRYELKNHIVDLAVENYYKKEKNIDITENLFDTWNLNDFIESHMINYLIYNLKEYLLEPNKLANEFFDQIRMYDGLFTSNFRSFKETGFDSIFESGLTDNDEPWMKNDELTESTIEDFINIIREDFKSKYIVDKHSKCINHFYNYLQNDHTIFSFANVQSQHLDEYFLKHFIKSYSSHDQLTINYYFIIFRKFFKWLDDEFETELNDFFLNFVYRFKRDIIRCMKLSFQFINEFDVVDELFNRIQIEKEYESSFELQMTSPIGLLMLKDLRDNKVYYRVQIKTQFLSNLKEGDIIKVRLIQQNGMWKIHETDSIFPKHSKVYFL
jgi:hypothetical protein